jgi:hypothetical protein
VRELIRRRRAARPRQQPRLDRARRVDRARQRRPSPRSATLRALVDAGANVNLADRGGTTPYTLGVRARLPRDGRDPALPEHGKPYVFRQCPS